jgi:hypothetical protein
MQVFGSWTPAAGQPAQPPVRPLEDVQVAVAPEGVSLPMQQLIHLIDRPGAEQVSWYCAACTGNPTAVHQQM